MHLERAEPDDEEEEEEDHEHQEVLESLLQVLPAAVPPELVELHLEGLHEVLVLGTALLHLLQPAFRPLHPLGELPDVDLDLPHGFLQ